MGPEEAWERGLGELARDPASPAAWRRFLDLAARAGRRDQAVLHLRDALAAAVTPGPAPEPGTVVDPEAAFYAALYGAGFGLGDPLFQYPVRIGRLAYAPDGRRVAIALERFGIHLAEVVGPSRGASFRGRALHPTPRLVDLLGFTPDGRLVAAGFPEPEAGEPDPRLWLALGAPGAFALTEHRVAPDPPDPVRAEFRVLGASADLTRLFAVGRNRALTVLHLDPAAPGPRLPARRIPLPETRGLIDALVVHPAGTHLVARFVHHAEGMRQVREYLLVDVDAGTAERLRVPADEDVLWCFQPAAGMVLGHWEDPHYNPPDFRPADPGRVVYRKSLRDGHEPPGETVWTLPSDRVIDRMARPGFGFGDGAGRSPGKYRFVSAWAGPDGRELLLSIDGDLHTLAPQPPWCAGEKPRLHKNPVVAVRAAETGPRLLTWSDQDTAVWDTGSRTLVTALGRPSGSGAASTRAIGPHFDAAGRRILFALFGETKSGQARGPQHLALVDRDAGRTWQLSARTVDPYWTRALALAPDGESLAIGMWEGDVRILVPPAPFASFPDGAAIELREAQRFQALPRGIHLLAFDPYDPGRLWVGERGADRIRRVEPGRAEPLADWPVWAERGALPDTHLPHPVAGLFGWGPRGACAFPRDGGPMRLVGPPRAEVGGAALSRDGRRLALALGGARIEIHDLAPGGAGPVETFEIPVACTAMAFGADDRLYYAQGHHVRIRE